MEYNRTKTVTGVPIYQSTCGRVRLEGILTHSKVIGSKQVFGQWVSETDHRRRVCEWWVIIDGVYRRSTRTLKEAKEAAQIRINSEIYP